MEVGQDCLTRRIVHNAVINPQGSKQFLKQIVPITVSFLLHQRVEFDEIDFVSRDFAGKKYKVFNSKVQNATLQKVKGWLIGILDALEKNYLREVYIIIENAEDPDDILESYKIQFKYMGDDAISMDIPSTKANLQDSTTNLITSIESLIHYPLNKQEDVKINMMLSYYDDVTPKDYEPPFFCSGNIDNNAILQSLTNQSQTFVHLGYLKTGHHIVKCRGKSDIFLNTSASSSMTGGSFREASSKSTSQIQEEGESSNNNGANEIRNNSELSSDSDEELMNDATEKFILDNLNCICKVIVNCNFIDTVRCMKCLTYQHSACLGYLQASHIGLEYVCPHCDPSYITETRKLFIFCRLALAGAYLSKKYPANILDKLQPQHKEFLLQAFKNKNVFIENDDQTSVNLSVIEKTYLETFFPGTFKKKRTHDSMTLTEDTQDENQQKKNKTH